MTRATRGCTTLLILGILAIGVLIETMPDDAGSRSARAIPVVAIGIVVAAFTVVAYFRSR